jgi:hypothetical protein
MKITFIYAYEQEEWSTPLSVAKEFQSQGWDIEFVSIGSNKTGQYHDRDIKTWLDSKPQTDIVLFMDWGRFDSPLLDKNLLDAFWVQESGDDPQNFDRNFPKSERFHITLSPDSDSTEEYKKRGRDAYWWTHFADTRVQYPMDRESEYVAVTSRGIGCSEFLDMLTQHGGGTIGNQNGFNSKEHTEFLNKGLMVIQKSRFGEVTRRIFEGMACGKMVLCDRLNESKKLHELFKEGDEIIFYDDMVDCITKMNKYNEDDTERNRIAKNGYKKVLENHTQKQRVEFIIDRWKNYQSV